MGDWILALQSLYRSFPVAGDLCLGGEASPRHHTNLGLSTSNATKGMYTLCLIPTCKQPMRAKLVLLLKRKED